MKHFQDAIHALSRREVNIALALVYYLSAPPMDEDDTSSERRRELIREYLSGLLGQRQDSDEVSSE